MSNELLAFIDKAKVPSREAWQAAIDKYGFDLQLNPEMKPLEDSAFSPCTLMGKASGVEIWYDDDPELLNDFSSIHQGRNFCITFRWGGDMGECACASIASYVLAKDFGAIVSYQGDGTMSLKELLQGAREALDEVKKGG